jgi:thiamine pyrophosphokinase
MRRVTYPVGMQIVIFAGGAAPSDIGTMPDGAFVIAADSGFDIARRHAVAVDLLIGDLDSVSEDAVHQAPQTLRFPVDKNETDLELAIDRARSMGVTSLLVIGGAGGRMDHFLANASLLASLDGLDVEWRTGSGTLLRVNGSVRVAGTPGETISLLAFGGPARGVRTTGLRWRLDNEHLLPGSTRGVSNAFIDDAALISLDEGNLMVVLPER